MKNVLITGGTRGIGYGILEEFVKNEWFVYFTYSSQEKKASEIEKMFPNTKGIKLRAGTNEFTDDLENLNNNIKHLDVLICNIGVSKDGFVVLQNEVDWEQVIDINLNSTYRLTKKILPKLLGENQKSIIYISSTSGVRASAGQSSYSASKFGIIGFAKSLALELARINVRVNIISPGYIDTDMVNKLSDIEKKKIVQRIPLQRLGTSFEVAQLAYFLSSGKAQYITGQNFVIDGGLTI